MCRFPGYHVLSSFYELGRTSRGGRDWQTQLLRDLTFETLSSHVPLLISVTLTPTHTTPLASSRPLEGNEPSTTGPDLSSQCRVLPLFRRSLQWVYVYTCIYPYISIPVYQFEFIRIYIKRVIFSVSEMTFKPFISFNTSSFIFNGH